MTSKRDFLAQHPLFNELYENELEALVAITEERDYPEGAVIAYQRDVGDSLYLVKSGLLLALSVSQEGQIVSQSKQHYMTGHFFNDSWLFTPGIHSATVKAIKPSRVLIIKGEAFLKFIEKFKISLEYLGLTPEAQQEARRSRVALPKQYAPLKLQPDELVEWQARLWRTRPGPGSADGHRAVGTLLPVDSILAYRQHLAYFSCGTYPNPDWPGCHWFSCFGLV